MFLVATNVVASRPPKRRPSGTPHARANCIMSSSGGVNIIPSIYVVWENIIMAVANRYLICSKSHTCGILSILPSCRFF